MSWCEGGPVLGVLHLGESSLGSVVGQLSSCWHSVTTDALSNGKQLVIGISCYWDFWRKSVVRYNLTGKTLNFVRAPSATIARVENGGLMGCVDAKVLRSSI